MIPQNFADAFARVKELVSIFSENEERYLSPGYSEAQARLDFIDKFWIALGWDVGHENQTDPYKQEVKVERGVATNEWRKRSDYAFLSPNFRDVRFYVEAKKPHVGLDNPHSREYLLGLLNSRLLEWIIHQTATQFRGGWYSYESRFIRGLPIRTIDSSNPVEKTRHDRMVQLVTQMLDAKQQLASAQTERDKTFYENKCSSLDTQIDNLVYDLYDLTPDEIAIVGG